MNILSPRHLTHMYRQKQTKRMEKIYNANTNQKKGGVATLISDKVDF